MEPKTIEPLGTGICDLCMKSVPAEFLNVGSYTVRGEELVVCDDCKRSDAWKGI